MAPHLALTLFLSACLLMRAAEPAPAAPTWDALPQEITQFYMDANFVSCFSTAASGCHAGEVTQDREVS